VFLQVKFHDNDFIIPMNEALEELYANIKAYNGQNEVIKAFKYLNEKELLKPMIHRLWVLKSLARDVESMTRHLKSETIYTDQVPWIKDEIQEPIKETYTKYFEGFDIEFHTHLNEAWNNGEDSWLNLHTGEVTNI
jgi:hypothetical protein